MQADTGKEADVQALLARAQAMSPPVKSIFHVAGVSVDVLLPEMKPENYAEVADCKARGAWFLHQVRALIWFGLICALLFRSVRVHAYACLTNSLASAPPHTDQPTDDPPPLSTQHSLDMGIENFVCVSSIAALIGGPGMASYSSANAYLDALMRFRRQQGLPGTTFNMASLSDVGILKNNLSARKFQLKVRACVCGYACVRVRLRLCVSVCGGC